MTPFTRRIARMTLFRWLWFSTSTRTPPNTAPSRVEIDWQESEGETFVVRLVVGGEDRRGLYADICEAISESGTNIRSAELASRDGAVFGTVLVEVENQNHLNKVMKAIRRLKGVTDVARQDAGAPA